MYVSATARNGSVVGMLTNEQQPFSLGLGPAATTKSIEASKWKIIHARQISAIYLWTGIGSSLEQFL